VATEEEIKKLAHEIWEQEGRPEGKDVEHYFSAKKQLEEQEEARVIELGPASPIPQLAPQSPVTELSSPRKRKVQLRRRKK
jgi:Protein of unknown function (DUF2934)